MQSKLNQAEVADIITSHKKLRAVLTHLGNLFQCLHFFPLLFLFIAAFALCFFVLFSSFLECLQSLDDYSGTFRCSRNVTSQRSGGIVFAA